MQLSALFRFLLAITFRRVAVLAVTQLNSATELYEGIQSGMFDVILDVRTASEWESGHIANATLLESLQSFNTSSEVSSPQDLYGCRFECTIVVYCASGNRAGQAAAILEAAGFRAPVYNGLGVSQWTAAGYDLVTSTPSVNPPCNQTMTDEQPRSCRAGENMPTNGPTGAGTSDGTHSRNVASTVMIPSAVVLALFALV